MQYSKLVVVQAFASQVEADLAKTALESAGIDARVQADRAGGMRDHLAWSGIGFKVLVRDEDAGAARAVLKPPQPSELVLVQTFATETKQRRRRVRSCPQASPQPFRMTALPVGAPE